MTWQLFLVPLTCAFSCWFVIKLFFTILFRPLEPRSFLGIKIQGLLPAKQSFIASKTGKIVAEQFITSNLIEQKITDPAQIQKIMPVVEEHIDDFLRNKLKKEMPFIGMFVGDKTVTSLKKVFMTELESLFPKIIGGFVTNIVNDLNIEKLVSEKIMTISIPGIETAFHKDLSKELRMAEIIAGLVGLLIGFLCMALLYILK